MRYSVTALIRYPHGGHTVWVEARSLSAARKQFQTSYPKEEIKKICRLKSDADFWRRIWWRAYQNMPAETAWDINPQRQPWVKVEGKVSLPDFIKQCAKGTMKIEDGTKFKLHPPPRTSVVNAKKAALSTLLGYTGYCTFTFNRKQNDKKFNLSTPFWGITNGMAFGVKPKGERGKLLLELAGPNGKKYALKKLGRS
jgi:hypothetical protein